MILQEERTYNDSAYERIGQLGNWKSLLLMANALRYGFSGYLLPRPGMLINVKEAINRAESIQNEWTEEKNRRDHYKVFLPAPPFSSASNEFKCFLHKSLARRNTPNYTENYSFSE